MKSCFCLSLLFKLDLLLDSLVIALGDLWIHMNTLTVDHMTKELYLRVINPGKRITVLHRQLIQFPVIDAHPEDPVLLLGQQTGAPQVDKVPCTGAHQVSDRSEIPLGVGGIPGKSSGNTSGSLELLALLQVASPSTCLPPFL
ncbi:hypothetical protein Tco_1212243 [Tanacetum coccineum]